jgi:HNH endonuclease
MEGVCSVDKCKKSARRRGMCGMHDQRVRRSGNPGEPEPRCAANGTGRNKMLNGYIMVTRPGHPLAGARGRVYEHRLVVWDAGLLTDPTLAVHHRNGDRADNRIENLEVLSHADHLRLHQPPKNCTVDGCSRPHYGSGLCSMHWRREWRRKRKEAQ